MKYILIKNKKIFKLSLGIFLILMTLFALLPYSPIRSQSTYYPNCSAVGCYNNDPLQVCTGPGGCVYRYPNSCYDTEFDAGQGYCCDKCDANCGSCQTCDPYSNPGCPTYYTSTNTGCSSTGISCTRYYSVGICGSCGTTYGTCYLVKYTVNFYANTGGYISGTTSQSVCRGSSTSNVTAVANEGYAFTQWSDGVTSATRNVSNVTANTSVTAYFEITNQTPTAPTNLLTEGQTNPTNITNITPEFSAIYNDPDTTDTSSYYEVEVNTSSTFTGTVMWDSGKIAMTTTAVGSRSPNIVYNGTTLTYNGQIYYWRIRFWDSYDAVSPWSSANFTMEVPTSSYYEIEVNTASDFTGTVMWDSGKTAMTETTAGQTSPELSYAGSALDYTTTYYWRIRFWDMNDNVSSWSETATFKLNAPPSTPTDLLTEGQTNPNNITDFTPELSAIYDDPDTTDTSSYYEIEVNTASDFTGTVMWDSGKTAMTETTAGQRSPVLTYSGSTLDSNVIYYWRIRFWDMVDSVSPWSDTATFKINRAPTSPTDLLTEGQTNPTTIKDTTPEFSAIFDDPDTTDTSSYYEIEVNTASDFTGTVMWDSGKTSMTTTNEGSRSPDISYAGDTLSSETTYYWRIKFWDSVDNEGTWSDTATFKIDVNPTATDLLIIDETNPTQVIYDPYFSAIYTDPNSDDSSAYQIEVNTASNFAGTTMWDSTKTSTTISSGNRSSDITYDGTDLDYDGTTYYVRMKFWDTDDNESDWVTGQFTDTLKSFQFEGLQMNGIQLN
jgi:hypothetical protein